GYTGILHSTLVNNFRWGFTRESIGDVGDSNEQWIFFRGISQRITRTRSFQRPLHNFSDDLSWVRGKHTFQFGGSLAFIRNPRNFTTGSFSDGVTNASWLDNAAIAGTNSFLDPGCTAAVNASCTWNFTMTYGLRYSLFSPPWETKGLQVAPNFSLGGWLLQRGKNMAQGIPASQDKLVQFDLAVPANGGKKGYYDWDYHNFGPRLAF